MSETGGGSLDCKSLNVSLMASISDTTVDRISLCEVREELTSVKKAMREGSLLPIKISSLIAAAILSTITLLLLMALTSEGEAAQRRIDLAEARERLSPAFLFREAVLPRNGELALEWELWPGDGS